jgi:hypothetical protein
MLASTPVDCRVIFWSGRGESSEYDVLGADHVIAWADAEAGSRGSTYALYAKVRALPRRLVDSH